MNRTKEEEVLLRVFAYDPGLTTGVAMAKVRVFPGVETDTWIGSLYDSMSLAHVKFPQEQVGALRLWRRLKEFAPDVVVAEDFRLFPDVPHSPDPRGTAPDRILAMMDLLLHLEQERPASTMRGVRVEKQMPGERMVVTDDWIKSNGLWRTPKHIDGALTGDGGHAMDALRHLVVFVRKVQAGKVRV